ATATSGPGRAARSACRRSAAATSSASTPPTSSGPPSGSRSATGPPRARSSPRAPCVRRPGSPGRPPGGTTRSVCSRPAGGTVASLMTATERITMVVLNDDGSRDKFTLSSWVGIPRKHELMWIGDDPYMIIEVEYAVSEGFFGARSIDAAGVYVRRLTKDEQDAVARRLANPVRGKDEQPFRP